METEAKNQGTHGQQALEQAESPFLETPRNPELAREVAKDAQRVVLGELSEEEFYDKYHKAYLQEFGMDNRPVKRREKGGDTGSSSSPGSSETQPQGPGKRSLSRRAFLMLAGGGAAALALTTSLGSMVPRVAYGNSLKAEETDKGYQGTEVQMGMVIDLERCTGCLVCVDACHRENNLEPGVHWMYVLGFKEAEQPGTKFLVRPCQHCTNPPCVKVCPTLGRHKREKDGLVLTDYDVCIGTRYCEVACPYGVNYFQWGKPLPDTVSIQQHGRKDYRGQTVAHNPPRGVMGKCTFCPQRQDSESKQGTTACQQNCPHDAIFFGDMNNPNSPPNQYLSKKRKEKGGILSTFRLLDEVGTGPNILYIGHQPSKKAKQVDGPITYEDWGWVDERGTVLGGPRPWFMRIFGG